MEHLTSLGVTQVRHYRTLKHKSMFRLTSATCMCSFNGSDLSCCKISNLTTKFFNFTIFSRVNTVLDI
jgi:hypothetical protein